MFYAQFEKLCIQNGFSPTLFVKDTLKLSTSKVTAWKNGSIPKYGTLKTIADYFGVTVGYLFDGTSGFDLSESEKELLDCFRQLSPVQQGRLLERAAIMSEQNDTEALKQEKVS